MYNTLFTNLENGIFTITINRPDKMNALNQEVMNDLNNVMDEVYKNAEIKSVIITGTGEKAFVAGADISEFSNLSQQQGMALAKKGQDIFFKVENSPKPIIAAVNGFALGGGCELAMACHMRIASDNAKFGQPEVNLGLIPGYGGTQRLPILIGKGKAMEFLLTGNMIDAATALQLGLVNYVVPQDQLLHKAKEILTTINSKAPIAIAKCINAANHACTGIKGYEQEIFGFSECFITEDVKEGTAAFLEKRKPNFKGR
ncbi:MAG TPA: enoyl-CoA hydratase-related protein [Chitinophagaceae bacterium]